MDYLKRTWAEIDNDALLYNLKSIRERTGGRIAAVVKANAYGHGAAYIAPLLEKAGVSMFAVSNIDEALELRQNGIKSAIMILGYTPAEYVEQLAENNVIQTVFSLSYAEELSEKACECGVLLTCHIKIDTGMSRLGFDCRSDELCGMGEMLAASSLSGLKITGAFTHFAAADRDGDEDGEFTAAQYARFSSAVEKLIENGVTLSEIHCCNSAGLMLEQDKFGTLTRPGIILYGLMPDTGMEKTLPLRPVMNFYSTVSFVKTIRKGDSVSYGRRFTADRDMTVATIPVGYADGYPRALSGKGYMLVNGKKAPVLGNVCMDQTIIDVSDIDDVEVGTRVMLFGEGLPAEEVASLCGTIGYELICGVSRRVPRVYIQNGKETHVADYILHK
ncbi:MAG: alanine racemase [Clostridia bacterium]|nr:alanine racemase [Clostridia bacterium]